MTVRQFCWLLNDAKVGKNDKAGFPRWVRRYASLVESVQGNLSVTEAEVIGFLRTLRDNGTPAWQRLQAVRAVELYRNLVLKTDHSLGAGAVGTQGRGHDDGLYPGDEPAGNRGEESGGYAVIAGGESKADEQNFSGGANVARCGAPIVCGIAGRILKLAPTTVRVPPL